jgi:hypothetical protein
MAVYEVESGIEFIRKKYRSNWTHSRINSAKTADFPIQKTISPDAGFQLHWGQGAPLSAHSFTLAENSSWLIGTGNLPCPGSHPHITSLSEVRCSTS